MGKKSLIKSTSKKAKAKSKEEETKTRAGKTTTKAAKSAKSKKTAAKKSVKAKAKSTSKKTTPKTRKTTKKKTAQNLLLKQFKGWAKVKVFSPPAPKPSKTSAPSFVSGKSAAETKRIRKLLFNVYSMEEIAAAAKKQSAPSKSRKRRSPAKKPTLGQLLLKKFDTPPPAELFKPPPAARTGSAPPLIDAKDKETAARCRQLLKLSFSMQKLAEAARKAAEEKAAREKAEAEKKAAEKAARQKAEAEKKAAQKTAAEKAEKEEAVAKVASSGGQDDEPRVKVAYAEEAPVTRKEKDPVENAIKIFIAGLAFLILLVVGASIKNSGKYYIKEHDGAIEITKGKFAPLGQKHFITLPGVKAPEKPSQAFSRKEIFPLIFRYYLDKADNLLQSEGLPDFEGIKAYLEKALTFATSNQMRSEVYRRLDNIDRIVLMYKAEVAVAKDTRESLEEALDYLQEAKTLADDPDHKNLIGKKIEQVKERLAAIVAEAEAVQSEAQGQSEVQPENTEAPPAGH